MINFCTLFDSNYLTRGLALYKSLTKVCSPFRLFVVAFDDNCYNYLSQAGFPHLSVISLKEFEDEQLLAVKPTRSTAEYCWTSTSSVILYCIKKYDLPSCTYIDADMIFYQDPAVLLSEMKEKSILITEHRYSAEYDQSARNGIYCVQFMCFRNTTEGLTALEWWRERCLEWCYSYPEDGKFGDQKYLDDWTTRFPGVHVLEHPGGGVAPWNLQQYQFRQENGNIYLQRANDPQVYPLVFFHFHGLKFYKGGYATCCGPLYDIGNREKELLYLPYLLELLKLEKDLKQSGVTFDVSGARTERPNGARLFYEYCKALLITTLNGRTSPFKLKNYNFGRHFHLLNLKRIR